MKIFARIGTLKKSVFILLILTAVLMFAACSNSENPDDTEANISGQDETAEENKEIASAKDFTHEISDGTATITKYNSDKALVNIPDNIDGINIIAIGEGAFYENKNLTDITIPDSVTNIGPSAFTYCTNLTSVSIGNGVASIGAGAFFGCTNLTSVTILNNDINITEDAFAECPTLEIICSENSTAHQYAIENDITFSLE